MSLWTLLLVTFFAGWACGGFTVTVLVLWLSDRRAQQRQADLEQDSPFVEPTPPPTGEGWYGA